MKYIRIECLEIDYETAIEIAKVLRKHMPDFWQELSQVLREAEQAPLIDDAQRN